MPHLHANGINIYYELSGSGPRLLFISGTGGDLRVRPNVFDGPLAAEFELLSYDQRGLGQTDKPDVDCSMADYADDAAALLDQLGWESVPVMGVSFGGMVAQELALRHPQRVTALVHASTSAGGRGGASFALQDLELLPPPERAARQLELADERRDARWRSENPQRWQQLLEMAAANYSRERSAEALAGARRQLAARAGHNTFDRLAEIAVPVLLAGGEYDAIAPRANMEAMAGEISGSELRFFKGGHLFLVQDKSAYSYIKQWLEKV